MGAYDKFYQRSYHERRQILAQEEGLTLEGLDLPEAVADQMVENYLYNYDLPLGVATNFVINGENYLIPMAVEEPSVIAAASNGAKRLGNIQTTSTGREIIGQIVFAGLEADPKRISMIQEHSQALLAEAAILCPGMVKRGGGPRRIWAEYKAEFFIVYLSLDPCDAMGANVMNTVLEGLAPSLSALLGQGQLMSILSNYTPDSLATARVSLPFVDLAASPDQGRDLAQRLAQASRLAQVDPYRAVTHNKGIMNGVDAVLMATGNDWRAVEAGVHAYASRSGSYTGLSQWTLDQDQQVLEGQLSLPLQVATVGGTLSNHPGAQWSLDLLGRPSAQTLAEIITAVGLAQNFAALRALVSEGIQKGHMALQAKSLAMQVGASPQEAEIIAQQLQASDRIDSQTAQQLLANYRQGGDAN